MNSPPEAARFSSKDEAKAPPSNGAPSPDKGGVDGGHEAWSKEPPAQRKPAKPTKKHLGWLYAVCAVLSIAAVAGALVLFLRHRSRVRHQTAELNKEVDKGPRLAVIKVQAGKSERTITLPADARALVQTTVYAKTSGYVREIRVNKGDRVNKDDVLAILESPETDQQVAAARSDLLLKSKLAARARALSQEGLLSLQDRETAEANQDVSHSNLKRTLALADYEIIRAPFAGVVSARYVDPGALLPAATGSTQSAMPLVDIVNADILKATLFLGQDVAPFVKIGDPVEIWQDERPDQKIGAALTRFASALEPKTRTMLVEVEFDNRKTGIYPGTFVRVSLKSQMTPLPTVPSSAIFVRKGVLLVGRIEGEQVRFVPVQIGINTGKTTQITSGLAGGEEIALDMPSEVGDGTRVQVVQAPQPAPSASASAGPAPAR
jgi:membrane fusion protein, multidrug efflux system